MVRATTRAAAIAILAITAWSCPGPGSGSCNATNCSAGCCDSTGTCQAGTSNATCGTGGATCQACSSGQSCQLGVCSCVGAGCGVDSGTTDAGGTPDSGRPDGGHTDGGQTQDSGPGWDGGVGHIDHLVVVVLENHTFDNMFASFPGANGQSTFNLPGGGTFTAPHCADTLSRDLCHAHSCALTSWDGGAMDGWWSVAGADDGGDHLAWCQYQQADIPAFWGYAANFGLADNFHSSMLGPSFPGHNFVLAAQAGWADGNPGGAIKQIIWGCDSTPGTTIPIEQNGTCTAAAPPPCFDMPSAPDVLYAAGKTWKFYGTGITYNNVSYVWSMFDAIKGVRYDAGWKDVIPYGTNFDQDATSGTLPNVSWLVNQDLFSGHPPLSMCASNTWVAQHINKVINGPQWPTTAIIITWDDYGGFVDHAPPPVQYGCNATTPYGQGFRLPAIIISPWAKKGVFHGVSEQASVVRLIEELFDPAAVGSLHAKDPAARDDVAGSLLGAFDFNQAPLPPFSAKETCP
jgi:phospholipase C